MLEHFVVTADDHMIVKRERDDLFAVLDAADRRLSWIVRRRLLRYSAAVRYGLIHSESIQTGLIFAETSIYRTG